MQRSWRPAFSSFQSWTLTVPNASSQPWICRRCLSQGRPQPSTPSRLLRQRRAQSTAPADQPGFKSILDTPVRLVRAGRRHKPLGVLLLAAIPITSFLLGCWQVQRLGWKTDLIAKFEDRLIRDPLPLPPRVDPAAVADFDYRRVYARGRWRHDREMLIGPRLHDGEDGYLVVTPLEREDGEGRVREGATVLVNRGWIAKDKAAQRARPEGLPTGEVVVEGLLREPWKKNSFTPDNRPEEGKWYFPDVLQMAEHTGSQPVWIEATMPADLLTAYDRQARGVPIGRPAEVNLRNNHAQYIFTWFSLSAATSVMLWMVLKKPPRSVTQKIRQSNQW